MDGPVGRLHRTAVLRIADMSRLTYLIALAALLALASTGKPGPILAAGVLLVAVVTAHALITSPDNPKANPA